MNNKQQGDRKVTPAKSCAEQAFILVHDPKALYSGPWSLMIPGHAWSWWGRDVEGLVLAIALIRPSALASTEQNTPIAWADVERLWIIDEEFRRVFMANMGGEYRALYPLGEVASEDAKSLRRCLPSGESAATGCESEQASSWRYLRENDPARNRLAGMLYCVLAAGRGGWRWGELVRGLREGPDPWRVPMAILELPKASFAKKVLEAIFGSVSEDGIDEDSALAACFDLFMEAAGSTEARSRLNALKLVGEDLISRELELSRAHVVVTAGVKALPQSLIVFLATFNDSDYGKDLSKYARALEELNADPIVITQAIALAGYAWGFESRPGAGSHPELERLFSKWISTDFDPAVFNAVGISILLDPKTWEAESTMTWEGAGVATARETAVLERGQWTIGGVAIAEPLPRTAHLLGKRAGDEAQLAMNLLIELERERSGRSESDRQLAEARVKCSESEHAADALREGLVRMQAECEASSADVKEIQAELAREQSAHRDTKAALAGLKLELEALASKNDHLETQLARGRDDKQEQGGGDNAASPDRGPDRRRRARKDKDGANAAKAEPTPAPDKSTKPKKRRQKKSGPRSTAGESSSNDKPKSNKRRGDDARKLKEDGQGEFSLEAD